MPLQAQKQEKETWYECMLRYAKEYHLEQEVIREYNHYKDLGYDERECVFHALHEWDLLDYVSS